MIKHVLFFLITFSFYQIGISQTCYNVIANLTGLDNSSYLSQLETASCELRNVFPPEFQSDFKVFDFGFYSLSENMQGGFQAVWDNNVIPTANQQAKYYILFGRQLPDSKGQSKIWFKLKLPRTGNFECFEESYFTKVEYKITKLLNENNINFFNSEIIVLTALKSIVTNIIECCDPSTNLRSNECNLCTWSTYEAISYFVSKGFSRIDLLDAPSYPIVDSSCICSTNYNPIFKESQNENVSIQIFSEIQNFSYEEDQVTIEYIENTLIQIGESNNPLIFYGAITDNSILCSNKVQSALRSVSTDLSLEDIERNFNSADISIWVHLQYDNNTIVYTIKTKGIETYSPPPPPPGYQPLTKEILVNHVLQNCPPTIEINNFVGENVFEETWHKFATINFFPVFKYRRNSSIINTGGCRNTSPDGLATPFKVGNKNLVFPDASWYEVKASNCSVYLSSYENQIKGHILNLSSAHRSACLNNSAFFNIVTTANVNVASSVYRYAGGFKIKVIHWEAWYKISNSQMNVHFAIRTTLNRLLPSVFDPDFQSYLGYSEVILQGCN